MAELKGSKTEQGLLEAFAGESQANRKYLKHVLEKSRRARVGRRVAG